MKFFICNDSRASASGCYVAAKRRRAVRHLPVDLQRVVVVFHEESLGYQYRRESYHDQCERDLRQAVRDGLAHANEHTENYDQSNCGEAAEHQLPELEGLSDEHRHKEREVVDGTDEGYHEERL